MRLEDDSSKMPDWESLEQGILVQYHFAGSKKDREWGLWFRTNFQTWFMYR